MDSITAWAWPAFTGFVVLIAAVSVLMFTGERRKRDRDIEDRLASIEQLVGELTGDDLAQPPPREVRIESDRKPRLPGTAPRE